MLNTQFQKYWFTLLNTDIAMSGKKGSNKLRTLKLFKQNFGMEKYLQIRNPSLRKSLCKFRISNHNLKIESLRQGPRLAKNITRQTDELLQTSTRPSLNSTRPSIHGTKVN